MRFFFSLVAMAGMATLGYLYGPELLDALNQDSTVANAETLTPASPTEPVAPAALDERAVNASLDHIKGSMPLPSKLPSKVKQRAAQPRPTQKKTAAAPIPSAPKKVDELLPSGTVKPQAPLAKVSSRWIEDLSGPKARISMGKTRADDGCAVRNACERKPAPKDISLAGVVVKTDKLLKKPSAPLDGRLMQGNYVDETPAVYVE